MIQAYPVKQPGAAPNASTRILARWDQVEIDVIACGVCHSDLSLVNSAWGEVD